MPRPLRLDYPGAHFHITNRGSARQAIFLDDGDRGRFLSLLGSASERFGVIHHAYCLMGNHYHLLLESGSGRLSEALQHVNGSYGRYFNRRRGRVGHLFQGRFKSSLIDADAYLLEAVRYIELNPCRAELVSDPAEWPWSSHRARLGLSPAPEWLGPEVLERFGCGTAARRAYRDFVLDGLSERSSSSKISKQDPIVGTERFVALHAARARECSRVRKVPQSQLRADRPSLGECFDDIFEPGEIRRRAVRACLEHGYTMSRVAAHLCVHYTTISRWVKREREAVQPARKTEPRRM